MKKFCSYGPLDTTLHYHADRTGIIEKICVQLLGESPEKSGQYITVWGPRQTGKTWIMQQVLHHLQTKENVSTIKLNPEYLKRKTDPIDVLKSVSSIIIKELHLQVAPSENEDDFLQLFSKETLSKPLILIFDEFDALTEEAISLMVGVFQNIYIQRRDEKQLTTDQKSYLLHSMALIGIRSVLGVENEKGSPFNVQKSVNIPNLTFEETNQIFQDYQEESEQSIQQAVVEQLYRDVQGQPGLTCWFGELLTEQYSLPAEQTVTEEHFEKIYSKAMNALPNNNILNLVSKVKAEPYRSFVISLFQTQEKILFRYDNPLCHFLFSHGVVDLYEDAGKEYLRFASPFIQKRLFNYFSYDLFSTMGQLVDPFDDLSDTIGEEDVNVKRLLRRYELYLQKNSHWLLKDAPRRTDLRIYEAIFHFNLFQYLFRFFEGKNGEVIPEFPTGNGKIDLLIKYQSKQYGLELKSFQDMVAYKTAILQAAKYGKTLGLETITLLFFIEEIDETNRQKLEQEILEEETGITVSIVFIATAN